MRIVGVCWIGMATARSPSHRLSRSTRLVWPWAVPTVLALSLLLCVAGWPEARLGLVANAVIAASLAAMRYGILT